MADDKIIDFEAALLNACDAAERDEILGEALLLAEAFAPQSSARDLLAMADTLAESVRKNGDEGRHARRLAAALRMLARRRSELQGTSFQQRKQRLR